MSNKSIDKLAEQFSDPEELQAYSEAQYKTIVSLNKKIQEQGAELEKVKAENAQLRSDMTIASISPKGEGQFSTSDEETTCVIQIAMLKANALQRELVTDEVKRLEVFVKTLLAIRGQEKKKEQPDTESMSSEQLLKALEGINKDPQ